VIFDILDRILPLPVHGRVVSDDEEELQPPEPSTSVASRMVVPPYGQRKEWKPAAPEDYGI
jgi:SNW domain-containing protein 1